MTAVNSIKDNLDKFNTALINNEQINCDAHGNWYHEGILMRVIRRIFFLEDRRIANIAHAFSHFLDSQEKNPVKFSSNAELVAAQNTTFKAYLKTAKIIQDVLKRHWGSRMIHESSLLHRRVIALQYRHEDVNGGLKKAKLPKKVPEKLRIPAQKWKNEREILEPEEKPLTKEDEEFLKEVYRYPAFMDRLLIDKELQDAFFKWTIRDHNSVELFVEFPGMHKQIKESYLSLRIGRYRNLMKIKKQNVATDKAPDLKEKVLTLLFEGQRYSILDTSTKVTFSNNYSLSVKQIFDIFKDKNHNYGNVEVFANGINNWCSVEMGPYNPSNGRHDRIDLCQDRKDDWWKQLPLIDEITLDEGRKRYGNDLDGTKWGGKILSTREKRDRSLKGNHAYVEIAIPNPDLNGYYSIYQFTKSSKTLPRHWYQYARVIATTFKGRILYPEVSPSHPLRQHKGWGFTMTPEEGKQSMEWVRNSIRDGLRSNLAYQLLTENCAKWCEDWRKVLPHKIPRNLFLVKFTDSEPEGFLGKIFWVVLRLPFVMQTLFFRAFFFPFGSTTGKTVVENGKPRVVSLSNVKPWLPNSEFRIPGMQIERLDKGELVVDK